MKLESLRTFVTLAEIKSFTKTAQALYITQSTVTKRIKELENTIGESLFQKDKRPIELTAAGQILLRNAREILLMEEGMMQEIHRSNIQKQYLNVGCVNSLYEGILSKKLVGFWKKYPDISIDVAVDHSPVLLNYLIEGIIDVCFVYRCFNDAKYECINFRKDELIFVTGKDNGEYIDGISDAQIAKLKLCNSNLNWINGMEWYEKICRHRDAASIEIEKANSAVPFLKNGYGYGFVIKSNVEEELIRGDLLQIPILEHPPVYLYSYMIYRKDLDEKKKKMLPELCGEE